MLPGPSTSTARGMQYSRLGAWQYGQRQFTCTNQTNINWTIQLVTVLITSRQPANWSGNTLLHHKLAAEWLEQVEFITRINSRVRWTTCMPCQHTLTHAPCYRVQLIELHSSILSLIIRCDKCHYNNRITTRTSSTPAWARSSHHQHGCLLHTKNQWHAFAFWILFTVFFQCKQEYSWLEQQGK